MLFMDTAHAALYKNRFLMDGAVILFPDLDPATALKQVVVETHTKNRKLVHTKTTVARFAAGVQSRVHTGWQIF